MNPESTEFIRSIVEKTGTELTFTDFSIYAIPGFDLQVLYKGEESVYEVTRQNFSFQTASSYIAENSIVEGLEFTMTDEIYIYTFTVLGFHPDLTGWGMLQTAFHSKTTV